MAITMSSCGFSSMVANARMLAHARIRSTPSRTKAAAKVWDDLASRSKRSYAAMKVITDVMRGKGYTDYVIEDRSIKVKK